MILHYRGISLLSCVSKVFTKILNTRLCEWADEENVRCGEQPGYRKRYRTVDNVFVLLSFIQTYTCKPKGIFYVLFVDFSKAFESIPHQLLFYRLWKMDFMVRFLMLLNLCMEN